MATFRVPAVMIYCYLNVACNLVLYVAPLRFGLSDLRTHMFDLSSVVQVPQGFAGSTQVCSSGACTQVCP